MITKDSCSITMKTKTAIEITPAKLGTLFSSTDLTSNNAINYIRSIYHVGLAPEVCFTPGQQWWERFSL